jgi:hypothetical protein
MSGKYVVIQPTPADAVIPIAGEVGHNTGTFVNAILANPTKSYGKYVSVSTETLSHGEIAKVWSEVTGKPSTWVPVSLEKYEEIWGPPGRELGLQYAFGNEFSGWPTGTVEYITTEDLGLAKTDLINLKQNFETLKSVLT